MDRWRRQEAKAGELTSPVMSRSNLLLQTALSASIAILPGCASLVSRDFVPEPLATTAKIANMPTVRVWGDEPGGAALVELLRRPMPRLEDPVAVAPPSAGTLDILAISGGGEDGAFGAGLLVGWSEAGTRPDFAVVTGISAGALAAPFVFLGSRHDADLRDVFTKYRRADIYDPGLLGPFTSTGLVDSSPLANLIAHYVDDAFLAEVARERRKGRVLLIGTTNLDVQRPVLWDMGRIAMSGHPDALNLFRKVLLASASIPGVFPAVRIKVDVEGRTYEELHVDGGVTRQVFVAPPPTATQGLAAVSRGRVVRRLFVIRNGKVGAEWEAVRADVVSISSRAVSTLIKNQGIGDLYRIYAMSRAEGTDFNLAAIPATFNVPLAEAFDPTYMRALYREGYRAGLIGYSWLKAPPDWNEPAAR